LETQIANCEKRLEEIEARKAEVELALQNPTTFADGAMARTLQSELDGLELETAKQTTAWERAAEQLEAFNAES
jgi:protein subunit release factor A